MGSRNIWERSISINIYISNYGTKIYSYIHASRYQLHQYNSIQYYSFSRLLTYLLTQAMQLKVCKPYESASDLLLTYTLVLITTISLMAYLIFLRETLDAFMPWFLKTDFDFQSILNR